MNRPLVSIVITNWNGEDVIGECLSSLFQQDYKNIEVIVLDNNSKDRSKDIIKKKFKNVKLIESNSNLGFAEGNNVAVRKAKGECILLLNSDATVTSNFLAILIGELNKNKKIGVIQPKILYKSNYLHKDGIINSIGAFFTNTGFLYYLGYGKKTNIPLYNIERDIFSAYGACMLIRKKVIKEVGLFDSDFFLYFEETDFCIRVWLAGWKIVYTPKSVIYHIGGVSARKFGTEKVLFHSFKNRICSYLKNFEIKTLIKVMPLHLTICEGTAIIYLFSGRLKLFFAIQKALFWNIINLHKTLKKRDIIQRQIRKVRDVTFLPKVGKGPRLSYYIYLFKGLEYYKD